MTGTAETEAREFKDIYKLDVVVIPTNRPIRRIDGNDQIYRTQREKYKAIIEEVRKRHEAGQPVLLGTVTVDTSEILSRLLKVAKIPHEVLNAKNHAREAEIVMLAGQPGAVTIATNMAGRGTDIKLGPGVVTIPQDVVKGQLKLDDKLPGSPKTIRELLEERPQGLHVIGSERHESRRIDRQLRGRCSRQGDPGSSQFYISLEDPLMRLFGSQRISGIMQRLGMKEGEVMEHRWLNKSVETAQRRVEQQHYAIRKRTLEFDDVMNKQRTIVYDLRGSILSGTPEDVHGTILDVMNDLVFAQCERFLCEAKDAQVGDFLQWLGVTFPVTATEEELTPLLGMPEKSAELVFGRVKEAYESKCASEDPRVLPSMERGVFLQCIDREWQDYLRAMDDLRHSVNLRSYGQRDPLIEYKREAFGMFENLMMTIKTSVANTEFRATTAQNMRRMLAASQPRVRTNGEAFDGNGEEERPAVPRPAAPAQPAPESTQDVFASMMSQVAGRPVRAVPARRPPPPGAPAAGAPVVGRNDPCPCGSGKKYKKCCGRGQF